jgi:hypothetical protein
MTRQDFELIAAVLREQKASAVLVFVLANAFALRCPNFDKAKFLAAAG